MGVSTNRGGDTGDCNRFLARSLPFCGVSGLDTSDILVSMTNQPKTAQKPSLNEILEEIKDLHGFQDLGEARRWLREALDAMKRYKLAHGTRELDLDVGHNGEIVIRRPKIGTKLENPQRKLIGDEGYTLPEEERPQPFQAEPEEQKPLEPLFQRMLKERQNEKQQQPRKYAKRRAKPKTATAKTTKPARKVKSTSPVKHKKPGLKKGTKLPPRPLQTEPQAGTRSAEIWNSLKKHKFDQGKTRDELLAKGFFDHYPEHRRKGSGLAYVLTVKKQYMQRQSDAS